MTQVATTMAAPGGRGGLLEVFKHRYLLRLLVRKELRVRYQGSVLGFAWSYVEPTVQFAVYFFLIGGILNLHDRIPNFPVHIFSGLVLVHFFRETFNAGTRSVVKNRALVRKIYLPREMFPVASLLVSAASLVPATVVLVIISLVGGWAPSPTIVGSALLGFAIMAVFGMAAALAFSAANVFFRDFQNLVSLISLFITWSVPMIYSYEMVATRFGSGAAVQEIYLANPLAVAVILFQRAFWSPTVQGEPGSGMPSHLWERGLIMLVVSAMLVVVAQWIFRRLQGRFAEEL